MVVLSFLIGIAAAEAHRFIVGRRSGDAQRKAVRDPLRALETMGYHLNEEPVVTHPWADRSCRSRRRGYHRLT